MWRQPTEDDLLATVSAAELDRFRKSASYDDDPVTNLCNRAAALVREYIRTNGNVALAPDDHQIPESCISPAMDYVAFDLVKRIGMNASEERKQARKEAIAFFEKIAERKITVESWGADAANASGGPAIQVVRASRLRVTPEKVEGL